MAAVSQSSNGRKWHDFYPELGTAPVPIDPYISRAYFEKEQERIFSKVWLNIGRIEQLPNPGDYFVKDLAEIGEGLRGYPFSEISASPFCWTTELKANWKVIKDAFQEAYHVSVLHHRTIGNIFGSETNKYSNAIEFRLFSRHGRVSLYG